MIGAGRARWVLVLVPACFHPSYDRPACGPNGECPSGLTCSASSICEAGVLDASNDGALPIDGPIDGAGLDGKLAPVCLGTFVNVCVDPPQSPVTLAAQTIDTGSSLLCAAYTSTPAIDACVITGQSILVPSGAAVTVMGKKPLMLLSSGSITISGVLDAASHRGKPSGPAADAGPCPTTGFTNPTRSAQGGGGWGGSFGTPGGNGGEGASGVGGVPPAGFTTTTLRGGCPGSDGADNAAGNGGGARGVGGGAVLLLGAQTITIEGTVNASGQGGGGGSTGGGAGGGGSGGMIVLDAAVVKALGKCFANGGGGGEGGGASNGNDGGESSAPSSPGVGGNSGSPTGGDGGAGTFGTTGSLSGRNGTADPPLDDGGGGAGGGGAGVIKVIAPQQDNTNDPNKVAPLPS